MSIEDRFTNIIETLRLEIDNCEEAYVLDACEMYALVDGAKALKRRISDLEQALRILVEATEKVGDFDTDTRVGLALANANDALKDQ